MKTIKYIITILGLIMMIAVSGLAQATGTVKVTVDAASTLNVCTSIAFGTFTVNDGKDNSSSPCNIEAYSNNPDGFLLTLHGTDNGFYNSPATYEWDKLPASGETMDIPCASGCTEAWGWRIINVSSEYDDPGVKPDSDNGGNAYNAGTICGIGNDEQCWHTVNYETNGGGTPYGDELFIEQNSDTAENADFDLVVGVVTDGVTTAGSYQDTITITLTEL